MSSSSSGNLLPYDQGEVSRRMSDFRSLPATGFALRLAFGNLDMAFQLSVPWLFLLGGMHLVLSIIYPGYVIFPAGFEDLAARQAIPSYDLAKMIPALVSGLVTLMALSSIAVSWHRYLLLEEADTEEFLRLDWPVWRYAGNLFLVQLLLSGVFILFWIAVFIVYFVLSALAGNALAAVVVAVSGLLFSCWSVVAVQQLYLKLPAAAVGRDDYGLRDAWADSKGYTFRLLGFVGLYTTVIVVIFLIALLLAGTAVTLFGQGSLISSAAILLAMLAASWLGTIITASCLTTLYCIFAQGREV